MTRWKNRYQRLRATLLGLTVVLLLGTTSAPVAHGQVDTAAGYRVHALIRIPLSVPPDGEGIPDPGTTLVHTSTRALGLEKTLLTRKEWLESGVPYGRAWYPAVTVWSTGDGRP